MLGGIAVSTFSKTLALLFGALIFSVQVRDSRLAGLEKEREIDNTTQYMASKGHNIIPTSRVQRYVKGIDLRSAVEDNLAFKFSFGATFILASLAEF